MACLTDFFEQVSVEEREWEEHVSASFVPREPTLRTYRAGCVDASSWSRPQAKDSTCLTHVVASHHTHQLQLVLRTCHVTTSDAIATYHVAIHNVRCFTITCTKTTSFVLIVHARRCPNLGALWPLHNFFRSNKKRLPALELFLVAPTVYIRNYTVHCFPQRRQERWGEGGS